MHFLNRTIFVLGGIVAGVVGIDYFLLGNTANLRLTNNTRLGEWKKATVREACFPALEAPERSARMPKAPPRAHRVGALTLSNARDATAALDCYIVTHRNAVCDPHNRAYIVSYIGKYFSQKDAMMAAGKEHSEDELANVRGVWNAPANRAITEALAFNIQMGRLNSKDFGWSAPAEIKPLLEQHKKAADTCPAQVARNK